MQRKRYTYIQITVIVNESNSINTKPLLGLDIVTPVFLVMSKDFMSALTPLKYYEISFISLNINHRMLPAWLNIQWCHTKDVHPVE
jgi:hypothetical protein